MFTFNKDIFVPKASIKARLRTVVLTFAIVCGLYIFSICIKQQTNIFRQPNPLQIQVIDRRNRACRNQIEEEDIPYVHIPKPETFSRLKASFLQFFSFVLVLIRFMLSWNEHHRIWFVFRQECVCNPVRYFVIVSMQRSGSGWFETLLNSHVNLSSNGEIFGAQERRNNVSVIYKTLDKVYNLDWFSSASKNECSAAVGFKWMLNQGLMKYHEEIGEYFKRRGVNVIFLFRRNLLRRMVSLFANAYDKEAKLLNGTHKSHVHSPHEAQVLAAYKPTLNTTVLISHLRGTEQMVTKALKWLKSTRHIVLYYEDILTNRTKLVDVQDFLKLPRRNLTSLQVKIHNGPISGQISNFDEVQKTLKGTSYENLLNTDYQL